MNAAAATAMSSFCFRLFLFNDILSLLWSVPHRCLHSGNAASEDAFQGISPIGRRPELLVMQPTKLLGAHNWL